MKTCKICQNVYHDARLHCPTCGAFEVGSTTYDIGTMEHPLPILVVAPGAQRQHHARTVKIAVASCDPDSEQEPVMKIYVVYHEITSENFRAFCSLENAQKFIDAELESSDGSTPYQVGTCFVDEIELVNQRLVLAHRIVTQIIPWADQNSLDSAPNS